MILIEKGPQKGKTVKLPAAGDLTVGRDPGAGIPISDTLSSRLHFKFHVRDGACYVVDLASLNGTYLNGRKVEREELLKPGDQVSAGETSFSFLADQEAKKADALIGEVVGGYRLLERIGRGGMGTVYKATQLSLNREVALKILSAKYTDDKTFIAMFVQEARQAAALNHPNIVQVYDVGKAKDTYYFSMEYMGGGSVQDILARDGKIPVAQALPMIVGAAKGLEFAEKKNIVHCDIKPDNLMLTEDGMVKIGDLGLSKNLRGGGTDLGGAQVFGTPHYIAPEQAQGKPLDHRTDLYALGATFYRMVAGRTPFQGETARELVLKHVREEPVPLRGVDDSIPAEVEAFVQKLMKKEPGERHRNATELLEDLRAAMAAAGVTGGHTDLIPGVVSSGRRRRGRVLLLGGGALAAAVLLGVAFSGGNTPAPPPGPADGLTEEQRKADEEKRIKEALARGGAPARRLLDVMNLAAAKGATHAEVEEGYRRFLKEFPDSEEAGTARSRLEEVPKLREQQRLKSAAEEFATLLAEAEKLPPDDPGLHDRWRKWLERYGDTPNGGEVRARVKEAEKLLAEKRQREDIATAAWGEIRKDYDGLCGEERFGSAWDALQRFDRKRLAGTASEREVGEAVKGHVGRVITAWNLLRTAADQKEKEGKLEEALGLYKKVVERYGSEHVEEASRRAAKLEAAIKNREAEQVAHDTDADAQKLADAERAAETPLGRHDYATARAAYAALESPGSLRTDGAKSRLSLLLRDLGHAAEVMDALLAGLAQAVGREIPLPEKVRKGRPPARIESVEKDKITLSYADRVRVKIAVLWEQFSREEILDLARRTIPSAARTSLGKAVLGIFFEMAREAEADLAEAERGAAGDAAALEEIAHYRKRLAGMKVLDRRDEAKADAAGATVHEAARQAEAEPIIGKAIEALKRARDQARQVAQAFPRTQAGRAASELAAKLDRRVKEREEDLQTVAKWTEFERKTLVFLKSRSKPGQDFVSRLWSGDPYTLNFELGRLLRQYQDWTPALQKLQVAVQKAPPPRQDNARRDAHLEKARTYHLMGRPNDADAEKSYALQKTTKEQADEIRRELDAIPDLLKQYQAKRAARDRAPRDPVAQAALCEFLRDRCHFYLPLEVLVQHLWMREQFPEHNVVKLGGADWTLLQTSADLMDVDETLKHAVRLHDEFPKNARVERGDDLWEVGNLLQQDPGRRQAALRTYQYLEAQLQQKPGDGVRLREVAQRIEWLTGGKRPPAPPPQKFPPWE
ncbi:MAG: protein kinase [Planctomycetales bacterium]|nr:protein kinase [Planctomycetales bacterium]